MNHRIRCSQCQRPAQHCYCEQLMPRQNRFPVKLIQSKKESRHPFNTGRMAQISLSNCETLVVEEKQQLDQWLERLAEQSPVVAFPCSDALDISRNKIRPMTPIIFIDDTWRKAKRFLYEHPKLDALPKISIPNGLAPAVPGSSLRKSKKHSKNQTLTGGPALCTLESVVRCLEIL